MILFMKVPTLRFPQFSGEWEEKKLGDIGKIITGSTPETTKKEYYNGNRLFVSPIDIQDNRFIYQTKTTLTDLGFSKGRTIPKNSVLFVCIGSTIGKVAQTKENCITNQQINSIIVQKNKYSDNFLYSLLEHNAKKIKLLAGEQAVPIINKTTFSKIELFLPEFEEQQKIADFLTKIDDKIQQLTQKKKLLESYKKGVMQQLFSQQLRFKDDNGQDFPDWEEKTLGDVCICLDNLRKPLNENERQQMKGTIPYWGANNIMDYINNYIFNETIILLAEDGGNFSDYRTRPIANISHGKCWVNNHTHVLKAKQNILFNEFLFFSLVHKNITAYISGGTRTKLTKGEMQKIIIDIPSLEEQTKIANFLTAIDAKINLVEQQLTLTKEYKKGLLQQMFV